MMSLPEAAKSRHERIIAEADGPGWMVMWPDGTVEGFASRTLVLRAVKRRARGLDIHIAEIEWRAAR